MTLARIGLIGLAAALVALILWAAANASFGASFAAISADPWGLVTLADLYLGFVVAGVIVALVEKPLAAALWFVGFLVLGNVLVALWLAFRLPKIAAALGAAR